MSDLPEKQLFEQCLADDFQLFIHETAYIDLTLIEVTALPPPPPNVWTAVDTPLRQEPYALLFLGPEKPQLPQHAYLLVHATLGKIAGLFFVPVGRDGDGRVLYEAVVN